MIGRNLIIVALGKCLHCVFLKVPSPSLVFSSPLIFPGNLETQVFFFFLIKMLLDKPGQGFRSQHQPKSIPQPLITLSPFNRKLGMSLINLYCQNFILFLFFFLIETKLIFNFVTFFLGSSLF